MTTALSGEDLVLCHQEPIRVPGSVQPHGALLALEDVDGALVVRRASANLEALLGVAAERALGAPLERTLGDAAGEAVRAGLATLGEEASTVAGEPRRHAFALELDVRGARCRLDAVLHGNAAGTAVLELDGPRAADAATSAISVHALQQLSQRLHGADDVAALAGTIVREVRALVGFDRVMLYRFHADDHGEVVAESVVDGWPPYLGLHYPESDIPAQARELYRRNLVRCIAAVPYTPAPILPTDAEPLDLSFSHLRSVSPIHVEYLENMGVGASMSISLLDGERLWGLVACHHRGPRHVDAAARAACELLGTTFSLLLPRLEAAESERVAARLRDVERELGRRLADALPFVDGVFPHLPDLDDIVAADGVASVSPTGTRRTGTTPDEAALVAFAGWLARETEEAVFASDRVAERYAAARDWPEGLAGVLAVEISRPRGQYLMAFRRELPRQVRWAGRPDEKPVTRGEDGRLRLSPRRSFAAWSESVRGTSAPWTDVELGGAEALRRTTLDLIVATNDEVLRLNDELERSRESLRAFAHIAAHDLKEPLRGIANYIAFLTEDHGDALDADARAKLATIDRLAARGTALTDALLQFAELGETSGRRVSFALDDVVDAVLEAFAPELERRGVELRVVRPLPTLVGQPVRMEQILTNLVGNALKYTPRPDPVIEIAAEALDGRVETPLDRDSFERRSHVVRVSDNGIGIPPEQHEDVFRLFKRLHPPDAHGGGNGLGLAIVRRAVELQGGRVELDSAPGRGTTVRFSYGDRHGEADA